MKQLCKIYRCSKKEGMYLYVDHNEDLSRIPDELQKSLGTLTLSMTISLWEGRKLAQADSKQVVSEIKDKGFYLQIPPANFPLKKEQLNAKG